MRIPRGLAGIGENVMRRVSLLTVAAASLLGLQQASADDLYDRCKHERDPTLKLQACSGVIASSRDRNHVFWAHNGRGLALCGMDRCAEAVDDFSTAIRLDSSIAGLFDNRARAFRSAGRFEEAIADSDRAIKMAPTLAFTYFGKAVSLEKAGRYNAALTTIDLARAIDSGNVGVWTLRGKILGELDRYDEAYVAYNQAVTLNPDDENIFKARSETEHAQGHLEAAINDLRRYHASGQDAAEVAAIMSQMVTELNEQTRAREAAGTNQASMTATAPAATPVPVLSTPPNSLSNAENSDPAGCSAVRLPAARLACFDAVAAASNMSTDRQAKDEATISSAPSEASSAERRSVVIAEPAKVEAPSSPQPLGTAILGAGDLRSMHDTYNKNQARFFRDFKNRQFSAILPLHNVVESPLEKGSYSVSFGDGNWTGDVNCKIADQSTIDLITNLDKGDRMLIKGTIEDHTFGSIDLTGCQLRKG